MVEHSLLCARQSLRGHGKPQTLQGSHLLAREPMCAGKFLITPVGSTNIWCIMSYFECCSSSNVTVFLWRFGAGGAAGGGGNASESSISITWEKVENDNPLHLKIT